MALTDSEERRIRALELAVAKLNTAIKNLATKRQMSHNATVFQTEINELKTTMASLQSQLDTFKI